jgi:hypothetical protein
VAKRHYTPDEIRRSLEIYAVAAGHQATVRKMLKEAGLTVDPRTIRQWIARDHVDLYGQIRRELEAQVRENAAERMRSLYTQAADLAEEAMRQTQEALRRGELKPTEIPKALQTAMVSAGIAIDKDLVLTGNPNQIVQHSADVGDLVRELESVGIKIVVAGQPVIDVNARDSAPPGLPEPVATEESGKDAGKLDRA